MHVSSPTDAVSFMMDKRRIHCRCRRIGGGETCLHCKDALGTASNRPLRVVLLARSAAHSVVCPAGDRVLILFIFVKFP
jgi:hypothetical protein